MSKTIDQVIEHDSSMPPMKLRFSLLYMRGILDRFLPEGVAPTIKSKYVQIGLNQFRNDYLRLICEKRPDYLDFLRVKIGDGDIRTNKIVEVAENHNREEETNLNKIFKMQTLKQ